MGRSTREFKASNRIRIYRGEHVKTLRWRGRVLPDNVQRRPTWTVSNDDIRDLVEFYQTNSKLPDTILLRYLGSDKISILRYLKDDEDTMHRCILSSMDKIENTGKRE